MRFSLIIPSYNNASELVTELPQLLNYLYSKNYIVEVIVVNDGSAQKKELADFCKRTNLKIVDHETNLGKGASVKTGMQHATEDIRIFTDADVPFQYSIFDDMVNHFKDEKVKMICGSRICSDYFSKTPFIRRLGSAIFSKMVNIIMLHNLGDTQCGIKAFRKDVSRQIFSHSKVNGFAADIEWLFIAKKLGVKVKWVKAEFRNAGESSVVFWKEASRMLFDVLKLRLRSLFATYNQYLK